MGIGIGSSTLICRILSQYLIPATGLKLKIPRTAIPVIIPTFSILNPGNGTETIDYDEIALAVAPAAFSILNPGNGTETSLG